jgi:hypothetical protein
MLAYCEGTMTIELSDKELRLVKANLSYALENCPVEGGIMTGTGDFSTKQSFETLLKKLQAVQVKHLSPDSVH